MRIRQPNAITSGLTLLEVLILAAIIAVLIAMLLPARSDRGPVRFVQCMSNQKQLVLGELLWQEDHEGFALSQTLATNDTFLAESELNPALYPFQSLSNYLKDMKIFVCPADRTRTACTSYTTFTRTNLSYLANLSAIPNRTVTILTGDRHLEVSGQPVQVGVIALASNDTVHWTKELHASGKKTRGQLGFADGHVETVMDASLAKVFQRQNLATNLLAIP